MTLKFDEVLCRTERRELPVGCVARTLTEATFAVTRLRPAEWSAGLDAADLRSAQVHVDLLSTFLNQRRTACDAAAAMSADWEGIHFGLPGAMLSGDHRVRIVVTVAMPPEHSRAGFILARSPEIVIIEGPESSGGKASLLPVRPADNLSGLYRLSIDEQEGPVLHVNSRVSGVSWKQIAEEPHFKFSCLENSVREVFLYLALREEDRPEWADAWLSITGAREQEMPVLEGLDRSEAYDVARDAARDMAQKFCAAVKLVDLFRKAIGAEDT